MWLDLKQILQTKIKESEEAYRIMSLLIVGQLQVDVAIKMKASKSGKTHSELLSLKKACHICIFQVPWGSLLASSL